MGTHQVLGSHRGSRVIACSRNIDLVLKTMIGERRRPEAKVRISWVLLYI